MEKLIHLVWGRPGPDDALRERLVGDLGAAVLAVPRVRGLVVDVHDTDAAEAPPPVPPADGEDQLLAVVSVWLDSYDRQGPGVAEALAPLGADGYRCAAYLVTESVYDDYGTTAHAAPRDWPDGVRSPGVLTVALIHRPAGLDYREWIERWHGTQSPVSAELQPRTRYVRNEVVRALDPDAFEVHGIVEEAWPSAGHVKDPFLFFNASDAAQLNANVARMLDSVGACLDMDRFRTSTMSEWFVQTVGGAP